MKNSTSVTVNNIVCKTNDEIANAVSLSYDLKNDDVVAYRAGTWFFHGLPLYINENVLVPRHDTEILVEEVLSKLKPLDTVLELCTGSGCISAVLENYAEVTAVDICEKALSVACKNTKRTKIIQSNLFEKINQKFNIIVSNPPYIKTHEIGKYDKSILNEPQVALDGGSDGLDFYRKIITQSPDYLSYGGYLFLEVGCKNQAQQVKTLLRENNFHGITIVKDRVVYACKID